MYESTDGKKYDNEAQCRLRDKLVEVRNGIIAKLAPLPSGVDFANGEGFIQYDIDYINNIKLELLRAIERDTESDGTKKLVREQRLNLYQFGLLGRYLDDGDSIFYSLYSRLFGNIDEQGREWGQGYYRLHPEMAQNKVILHFPF